MCLQARAARSGTRVPQRPFSMLLVGASQTCWASPSAMARRSSIPTPQEFWPLSATMTGTSAAFRMTSVTCSSQSQSKNLRRKCEPDWKWWLAERRNVDLASVPLSWSCCACRYWQPCSFSLKLGIGKVISPFYVWLSSVWMYSLLKFSVFNHHIFNMQRVLEISVVLNNMLRIWICMFRYHYTSWMVKLNSYSTDSTTKYKLHITSHRAVNFQGNAWVQGKLP